MEVKYYNSKVVEFIENLDSATFAKVARTVDLLEQFGANIGMPHSRRIATGLYELRIRGKQEVRLLYAFYQGGAIVLHGFIKKSDRLPLNELRQALKKIELLDNI